MLTLALIGGFVVLACTARISWIFRGKVKPGKTRY